MLLIFALLLERTVAHFGFNSVTVGTTAAATPRDSGAAQCVVTPPTSTENCGLGATQQCAGMPAGCGPCAMAAAVTGTLPTIAAGASIAVTLFVAENHCQISGGNASACLISLYYAPTNVDSNITAALVKISDIDMTKQSSWYTAGVMNDSNDAAATLTLTVPAWTTAFAAGTLVAKWDVTGAGVPHVFYSCADFAGTVAASIATSTTPTPTTTTTTTTATTATTTATSTQTATTTATTAGSTAASTPATTAHGTAAPTTAAASSTPTTAASSAGSSATATMTTAATTATTLSIQVVETDCPAEPPYTVYCPCSADSDCEESATSQGSLRCLVNTNELNMPMQFAGVPVSKNNAIVAGLSVLVVTGMAVMMT